MTEMLAWQSLLQAHLRAPYCSEWLVVTQQRINAFAAATNDHQWIHVDESRAQSAGGCTIAHGYLCLSLYPFLRGLVNDADAHFPGAARVINYGINHLRFPHSVCANDRIRLHAEAKRVDLLSDSLQLTEGISLEIDGVNKPALVAEVVMRLYAS